MVLKGGNISHVNGISSNKGVQYEKIMTYILQDMLHIIFVIIVNTVTGQILRNYAYNDSGNVGIKKGLVTYYIGKLNCVSF